MPALTRFVGAVERRREQLAATARRAIVVLDGQRTIVALGGLFVVVAVWQAYYRIVRDVPPGNVLVLFVLVAAPAVGLLYGGSRLTRADVHPDFYPTIAGWCLATCAVIAAGLAFYSLQPDGGISSPVRNVPVIAAIGCFAGFSAGVHDARARTSARELAHRNRQLERTREELESTVDRLRDSNERLEQFAYAASHDLQEPLRMVSSYLQLLEHRYGADLEDEAVEFVDYAVDGADRMRAMIEALLEYSRVETAGSPLEPVDLEAVFEDVCTDLTVQIEETDAEVVVEDLPVVRGDRDQLRQVFQNLLDNAIEYSGDDPPRVHVSAEPAERPQRGANGEARTAAEVRADATGAAGVQTDAADTAAAGADAADAAEERADAADTAAARADAAGEHADAPDAAEARPGVPDFWTIAVRDEGIGIEPEHVGRIFEVFERLHSREDHPGTGIGLALCQRIVDRHGGEIWVDSEPGEGSTFFATLPAAESPEEAEGPDGVEVPAAQSDAPLIEH